MAKYKDKKSSGCALCKPWKHGWEPKHKLKDRFKLKSMRTDINQAKLRYQDKDRIGQNE